MQNVVSCYLYCDVWCNIGMADSGISSSGAVDLDGTELDRGVLLTSALERLLQGGGTVQLKVGVGNVPVNEYDKSGKMFYEAFPTLFMYGCGAPCVSGSGLVRRIPFEQHIRHLFKMKFRRFARHRVFPFALVNMIQRQSICRSVKASMPTLIAAKEVEALGKITPSDVSKVIHEVQHGAKVHEAIKNTSPALQTLVKHLRISGGCVSGSVFEKKRMNRELRAYMHTLGPPHLFATLNVNDFSQPLVVRLSTGWGNKDDLTPEFMRELDGLRVVAENPDAAAQSFDYIIKAFIEKMICVRKAGFGVYGDVIASYGVSETQGRGTLHLHILLWLKMAGTSNGIVAAVKEDVGGFAEKFYRFIDAIICQERLDVHDTVLNHDDHPNVPERETLVLDGANKERAREGEVLVLNQVTVHKPLLMTKCW